MVAALCALKKVEDRDGLALPLSEVMIDAGKIRGQLGMPVTDRHLRVVESTSRPGGIYQNMMRKIFGSAIKPGIPSGNHPAPN